MNIKIMSTREKKYVLQEGDIINFIGEGDCYMVVKEDNRYTNPPQYDSYTLRHMTQDYRANGYSRTLEELTESLDELEDFKIFKASEYELVLTRKE